MRLRIWSEKAERLLKIRLYSLLDLFFFSIRLYILPVSSKAASFFLYSVTYGPGRQKKNMTKRTSYLFLPLQREVN
jgi:hypothetical protein